MEYTKPPKKPSQVLKEAMGYTVPSPSKFGFKPSAMRGALALSEDDDSLTEAKSTFTVKLLQSKKNKDVVKVSFEGTFRGERIWGKSTQVVLGLDRINGQLVREIFRYKWRRENHMKEFPASIQRKIEKEAFEKLAAATKKVGGKVEDW